MSTTIDLDKYVGIGKRYIIPPSNSCDPDAVAFLTLAGITDATISGAICQLVTDLKTAGVWSTINVLYPFVGGTALTHKLNLKNTLAYPITWLGGVTHNTNGVTFNGINAYGDTLYNESLHETPYKTHKAVYDRSTVADNAVQIGAQAVGAGYQRSLLYTAVGTSFYVDCYDVLDNYGRLNALSGGAQGLWQYSRNGVAPGTLSAYKNGLVKASSIYPAYGTQPDVNTWIGALNNNGVMSSPTSHNLALVSMGSNMTALQVAAYYTAVQAFQTTLGRQV